MFHPSMHKGLPGSDVQYQCATTAVGRWGQITPIFLDNARENTTQENIYMHSKTQDQKKWRPKVLFLRKNCGMPFTTIVTDLDNISSAHTHFPSAEPEGFTQCLLKNLYNKFYTYLILLFIKKL